MAKASVESSQRNRRLEKARKKYREKRNAETNSQKSIRLAKRRDAYQRKRVREQAERREENLDGRRTQITARVQNDCYEDFEAEVNTFAEKVCDICTKQCYPKQVLTYLIPIEPPDWMPPELINKVRLTVCRRCKSHLTSKKPNFPAKAFWNNLDPGDIPPEIQALSQAEQRLLSRIHPFLKIVKFSGLYGQYGFKGQAILFALDIFEVISKLPTFIPRSTLDADIIIVTERLENTNSTRDYTVSRTKLIAALQWLKANNPLYRDVVIDENAHLDERDLIRLSNPVSNDVETEDLHINAETMSEYVAISNNSRIIHASWHQGNTEIFNPQTAGVQCCVMALATIVRSSILDMQRWSTNILNENMIEADKLYSTVTRLIVEQNNGYAVPANGYLLVKDFDVVKNNLNMFGRSFKIQYMDDTDIYGSLSDRDNAPDFGYKLSDGLVKLFETHTAGILITNSKSFAMIKSGDKFYFADSHSCGPKGSTARNGKACAIQCDDINEFHRICKRATGSRNVDYTINYIDVQENNFPVVTEPVFPVPEIAMVENDDRYQIQERALTISENVTSDARIPMQTSMMAPIDCVQRNVEDELEVSNRLNEIVRKTNRNIVNERHELKAEEFAWFYLFPYGINGLNQRRSVKISPLDYFQFRILGSDPRFRRNDYLFYALSMFEYLRVKSTISACGKKVQGQDGLVTDVHLYMKNLRGSAAYWHGSLSELLALIRCLGPPHHFITLSCNDLWWTSMRKALLIADNRPDVDPDTLTVQETQRLIEENPVVVSRQFMIRVAAIMKILKTSDEVFGSKVIDFWWRIEFQNRGSPHLHMVIWLENCPAFDTPEGLQHIDQTCSCQLPPEDDSELRQLVKKCQTHRHTATCKKNSTVNCRFGFPRLECAETKIVAHSSDEFVRSNGRIVLLKRRKEDQWVNNYNPTLLRIWKGNMDIQPCGTNEAIAYYVAKYISKTEPTGVDAPLARAIQEIRREAANDTSKIFKICMRILKERQVSACECVFRLCHLQLRDSSRNCVFLNTRKPEQRYKVLKFDEGGTAVGYFSNIFERYEKRPHQHPDYDFDNMPLMEFAMLFQPHYLKKNNDDGENVDHDLYIPEDDTNLPLIKLLDNTNLRRRTRPATIRVPYFRAATDPENFYYSLLLQYMPYRNEGEILQDFNTAEDAFLAREDNLKVTSAHMEVHRQRDKQLENAFIQVHAFQVLETYEPAEDFDEVEVPADNQIDDEEFTKLRNAMNVGQRDLYNRITHSIEEQLKGSTEREYIFITGGAGTGKTFTLTVLKNQINRCYGNNNSVKVCALTGVAARLVNGTTLHSTFKLPVQKDGRILQMPQLTGNYLRIMRLQWKDIHFLFIDEISMVPYEMLCMIESRLRQLKNADELFGGINVIVFGDLFQLPPVRGHQVFDQPEHMIPALHLWRCFSLCELTENMRQRGDDTFIDILNALRVGELRGEHINVLLQKVSSKSEGEFSIDRALRIYPTNQQVHNHNNLVLQYYKKQNTEMFSITAQDQIVDSTRNINNIALKSIIPADINKTGGLPKELTIFVGAKVMLRSNVDVSKGLVNGAIGFIEEIIWPHFRRAQMYEEDIPSVKVKFDQIGVHVIQPISIQFPAKKSYGTAERRMLPLVLSWASTVHKMQGSTVDHAVVNLGPKVFAEGQAYVALSRVRSLDGLRIEELNCEKLTGATPCNRKALEEMERLRKL